MKKFGKVAVSIALCSLASMAIAPTAGVSAHTLSAQAALGAKTHFGHWPGGSGRISIAMSNSNTNSATATNTNNLTNTGTNTNTNPNTQSIAIVREQGEQGKHEKHRENAGTRERPSR